MSTKTVADRIKHLAPCGEALAWAKKYTSSAKAWRECQRGDWMLWLLATQAGPPEGDGRKALVLCACDCAALVLPYTSNTRVGACLDVARRWARGHATLEELRQARHATATATAKADTTAEARNKVLAQCADIVRLHRHYSKPPSFKLTKELAQ